jgi:signal transduction histidine kinase
MGYLQSLEAFWKASRGYLSEVRPEDPSERKALDFILAEMPGLMSDVRARLERIADLVRDVGIFARAEGGGERRPVNLIGCLKEAVEMARSPLLGGAAFAESYDSEVIRVRANRQDLGRAFSHLLSNAVRAVQGREGPMVRIKAGIRDQGSGVGGAPIPNPRSPEAGRWAEVAVEDNGPGIPTEVRSRLFDPFFTTRPVGEGLGLGLPVCREIVREHGGEMGFESQAGEGARFWVRLPVVEGEG